MSRGCPPALREKRDWDALPADLRQIVIDIREVLSKVGVDGVEVDGRARGLLWSVIFTQGHKTISMDAMHLTLGAPGLGLFTAEALRRLRVKS